MDGWKRLGGFAVPAAGVEAENGAEVAGLTDSTGFSWAGAFGLGAKRLPNGFAGGCCFDSSGSLAGAG